MKKFYNWIVFSLLAAAAATVAMRSRLVKRCDLKIVSVSHSMAATITTTMPSHELVWRRRIWFHKIFINTVDIGEWWLVASVCNSSSATWFGNCTYTAENFVAVAERRTSPWSGSSFSNPHFKTIPSSNLITILRTKLGVLFPPNPSMPWYRRFYTEFAVLFYDSLWFWFSWWKRYFQIG